MTARKILITGAKGQVGWELQRTLSTLGSCTSVDLQELDLLQTDSVRQFVSSLNPDFIVNAAAYTAVDLAETETRVAEALNADVPRVLAEEAKRIRVPFVTYSTDYVFDGTSPVPYSEDSTPSPLSSYGRTKLLGDNYVQSVGGAHFIFRTSWVYGARGKNFLLTMLRLAEERSELRVVDDQVGAPTWCRSIAEATAQILGAAISHGKDRTGTYDYVSERRGIYNMVCSGETSWCGFTKAILQRRGKSGIKVVPIQTSDYPTPARRPNNSRLSLEKIRNTFGIEMPHWEEALAQVLESLP